MSRADWQDRFFATTRGRVLARLRAGPRTVAEVAAELGITDNAVRSHLQALQRDGLVREVGTRRTDGVGKPPSVYEAAPETDERFSRAYVPVLRAVLDALAARPSIDGVELFRDAGRRLGRTLARSARGPRERAEAAAAILTELGGAVSIEETEGGYRVRGSGCPLAAVTGSHPSVCRGVEALLEEATGAETHECCDREGRPACSFELRCR